MALKLPRSIKGALRRYTRAVTELAVSVPFNVSAVEHSINREEYRQSRAELKECIVNAIALATPFPKRGEEQEVIGMLAKEIADIQYRIKDYGKDVVAPDPVEPDRTKDRVVDWFPLPDSPEPHYSAVTEAPVAIRWRNAVGEQWSYITYNGETDYYQAWLKEIMQKPNAQKLYAEPQRNVPTIGG